MANLEDKYQYIMLNNEELILATNNNTTVYSAISKATKEFVAIKEQTYFDYK